MSIGILNVLESLTNQKNLPIKELPTQGLFYPEDFSLKIKKASADDILLYNFNYIKDDISTILYETKRIIKNNLILSKNYTYEDIKSNDLLYIFFEIVKFTMGREILVPYKDIFDNISYVPFDTKYFNYFDYSKMDCSYNSETHEFEKYGYRFSLPSVGVENCLVDYLFKLHDNDGDLKNNYDFLFFLGNKKYLSDDEISNLITIFNEDIDEIEKKKIKEIINIIYPAIGYTLKYNNKIVNLDMKIDFETLFM
jgi:hypothetical protein